MTLGSRARSIVYGVLIAMALIVGSLQAAYAQLGPEPPVWLRVVTAVFAYLAGGGGILATLHLTPDQMPPAGDDVLDGSAAAPGGEL